MSERTEVIQHVLPTHRLEHIAAQPRQPVQPCQQTWGMEAWKRNPASPNRGCRGRPAASSSASCRPTSSDRNITSEAHQQVEAEEQGVCVSVAGRRNVVETTAVLLIGAGFTPALCNTNCLTKQAVTAWYVDMRVAKRGKLTTSAMRACAACAAALACRCCRACRIRSRSCTQGGATAS